MSVARRDGLRRLGYAQDRNLDIDRRYGDVEKLKLLAQTVEVFCIWQPAPPRSNSQQSCGTYGGMWQTGHTPGRC
jgi:hypothetical protein